LQHKDFKSIKGILSDIAGTLYFKGKPIPGVKEAVLRLKERGIKCIFFTNTDSKSPKSILQTLNNHGFKVNEEEIFTPIIALKNFLSRIPECSLFLVTTEEIKNEFNKFNIVEKYEESLLPDYVIIGDFRDEWDVHRLNDAFKYIMKGSKLLGTQGNRYFLDKKGEPVIDTGSFVNLVGNAAGVEPKIFGKPTKEYFLQALQKIQLKPEEVVVMGDDIETDIQGAINAGLKGILVKTGKGNSVDLEKLPIKPFKIIESFSSILDYINL
jgi:HAD superfamily hydrolase (TIGR01458 family)